MGTFPLAKQVTSDCIAPEIRIETLLKLRVSSAITKLALSYLKERKEIHYATTKTVRTEDKWAQRESDQLAGVLYRNKGSYRNLGPSP